MQAFYIKTFSCAKEGNSSNENEDSFFVPINWQSNEPFYVAVADGATESSFSREWAEVLVNYFLYFDYKDSSFNTTIHEYIRRSWLRKINANDLPWYAQQKLELGAFSSFLGIEIDPFTGVICMSAIGDTNLFIFRNDEMEFTFPIKQSKEFGVTPLLLSTDPTKNKESGELFVHRLFELEIGDKIILGTDAISQWILKEIEAGINPLNEITNLLNSENASQNFKEWLTIQRKSISIKNDDTTIILIQIEDGFTSR